MNLIRLSCGNLVSTVYTHVVPLCVQCAVYTQGTQYTLYLHSYISFGNIAFKYI